jgi:putative chitinase
LIFLQNKYPCNKKDITMPITRQQFANALYEDPNDEDIDKVFPALSSAMEEFNIKTKEQIAMFLAQCAHESNYFTAITENLNYSADGLRKIFPKYFRDRDADDYNRQPEKIANVVYANRMGNGDEDSGDGYRFRGRGYIQLTGRTNYEECGQELQKDLITDPDYLTTPEGAARSAAWFWDNHNLNKYADANDIVGCTKRINGGTIGLEDRTANWKAILEEL